MKTPKEKLENLRQLVIMELNQVEEFDKPNVYMMYNEPVTMESTIDYIIDKVIGEDRTISSAILATEREYNINFQND